MARRFKIYVLYEIMLTTMYWQNQLRENKVELNEEEKK